jgi:Kdo2-lipid IVA lauroyltransferase/acyltransferase
MLYGLALLPFWALYGVSNGLFLLVHYVLPYRKKLVLRNLERSFPELQVAERRSIARRYYSFLADLLLETLKGLLLAEKSLRRRMVLENLDVVEQQLASGRSVALLAGHVGNWEWLSSALALHLRERRNVPFYAIYHAIKNKKAERIVEKIRHRFGIGLVEMRDVMRHYQATKGQAVVTLFVTDQAGAPESSYWTTFLHQDTPFMQGGEKLGRRFGHAVVYADVRRTSRGHYCVRFELIAPNASETAQDEVMGKYAQLLEANIRRAPELWLWTHNRWKHTRPANQPVAPVV